ncbi:hypothetical protein [Thiothrix winogradskyi]|uniref:GH16 domain-containing protein n=1 Tax=Thiothrix winogradskyi TaxID=96472 RepID=A0ABY3T404_9GAMM|nr:hypothetical protein [Thiothrix winogradskyi]UJS26007.1 hypothetical protein L2Y54_08160 [Thiothrix winogradskyi]
MAKKKLNGRFYFELTTNYNLIGEYSSNYSQHSEPESASRIYYEGEDKNNKSYDFIGDYLTIWQEDGSAIIANLKIIEKPNCTNIYSLLWSSTTDQNTIYFTGEAMLYRNSIIGDYRPGR